MSFRMRSGAEESTVYSKYNYIKDYKVDSSMLCMFGMT